MPKYDAFGREIGEDTLAGLGGSEYSPERESADDGWTEAQIAEAAAVEPAPAVEPQGADPEPFAAAPEPARTAVEAAPARTIHVRRRGAGCFVAFIVLAVLAAIPIVAIVAIVGSATDAIDEVTDAIDSVPDDVVPAIPDAPPAPPAGIGGESLVARGNFERALGRIGGMGGATHIRLAPERLDAQLVRRSRQRSVQLTFDGSMTRGAPTRGGAGLMTIPLGAIDPGAPARLVRGSAARYRVRPRGINYLVVMAWPGEGHRWIAYFKNGIYVQGDRSGRVVRRIS